MVRGDIIPHSPVGKEASSNSGIFSHSQARCRPQISPCLAQFLHRRPCFLAKRLRFSHLKSLCWGSIHTSLPGLPLGWTKSMWRRCCKAECHPSLVQAGWKLPDWIQMSTPQTLWGSGDACCSACSLGHNSLHDVKNGSDDSPSRVPHSLRGIKEVEDVSSDTNLCSTDI